MNPNRLNHPRKNKMSTLIRSETRTGQSISTHGFKLTPFSRSLTLRIPGINGGLIWNRPASVLVQAEDGQEYVLPVIDFTRQVQWALYGLALGAGLLFLLFSIKNKSNRR